MPLFDISSLTNAANDLPSMLSGAGDATETPQLPLEMPSAPGPIDGSGMDPELKQMVFGGGLSGAGEIAASSGALSTGSANVASAASPSLPSSLFATNPALLF